MMRYGAGRLLAVGGLLLILELTILDAFSWSGARVEILLVLACFAAIFARDEPQALAACWGLGLLKDATSVGPFGWHALLFLAMAWIIVRMRQVIYHGHALTQILVAASGCAAIGLATAAQVSIVEGGMPVGVWTFRLLGSTILTGLLSPVIMMTLVHIRFLGR